LKLGSPETGKSACLSHNGGQSARRIQKRRNSACSKNRAVPRLGAYNNRMQSFSFSSGGFLGPPGRGGAKRPHTERMLVQTNFGERHKDRLKFHFRLNKGQKREVRLVGLTDKRGALGSPHQVRDHHTGTLSKITGVGRYGNRGFEHIPTTTHGPCPSEPKDKSLAFPVQRRTFPPYMVPDCAGGGRLGIP